MARSKELVLDDEVRLGPEHDDTAEGATRRHPPLSPPPHEPIERMPIHDRASEAPPEAQLQHVEEVKQAFARLAVCVVALLYMGGWSIFAQPIPRRAVLLVSVYALISIAWILAVRAWPGHYPARRIATIFGDLGINTFFMHFLQAKGAAFYPMYLWIIVGNGVRFGPRYLVPATGVGVLYFFPMLFWSPYWRANLVAGIGLGVGLIILPAFYLSLIRRLHTANERLGDELERSNAATEAKSQFLANMSHELRTPMSGVLGVSDMLRGTNLDDEQKKLLDLIQSSASSLLRILDDVLTFSRLEAGKVTIEKTAVGLRPSFEQVLALLAPVAEAKQLDLTWNLRGLADEGLADEGLADGEMPAVLADATRIRQILFNLIGNAIKFTEHGRVHVSCSWRREGASTATLTVEVADSGVGIADEALEHVFEAFEQAEGRRARRFEGTGLGLSISRRLARDMGGDIRAVSELGRGSTFTVELPLELANPEATDADTCERDTHAEPTLPLLGNALVVDDNGINRLVTSSFLNNLGVSTVLASDGLEALERLQQQTFDIVFMDIQMPRLDGLEATRRIRARENAAERVPIVALTANAGEQDRQECLEAGMDEHLRRPFTERDLRLTLCQLGQKGLIPRG